MQKHTNYRIIHAATGAFCLACAVIQGVSTAAAQSPAGATSAKPADRAADEAAIRKASDAYTAAVRKGDAKAIADFWTDDGVYTDETGNSTNARKLIEQSFTDHNKSLPKTDLVEVKVRFISPDVAMEEGVCCVAGESGSQQTGSFAAIWVRKDGAWKLANLRETRAQGSPASHNQLDRLDIFAGDWTGKKGELTMKVAAKWNATKTYMKRELSVHAGGKELFHGTQVIGWDPLLQEIRSWTFNDDGAYSDGLWSQEGNAWMVSSSSTKPDGQVVSSVQIFTFDGPDKMDWKSKRIVGDEPPQTEFEIELTKVKK